MLLPLTCGIYPSPSFWLKGRRSIQLPSLIPTPILKLIFIKYIFLLTHITIFAILSLFFLLTNGLKPSFLMTIRFSRAEYWLLDIAVEYSASIADLINGDTAGGINRTDHQCPPEELAEGLERLFADRLIAGYRFGGKRYRHFLTRPEIEIELHRPKLPPPPDNPMHPGFRHPDEIYYQLTPLGGKTWENFACPDWNQFIGGIGTVIGDTEDPPCPSRGQVICPSDWKLNYYLHYAAHIGHHIDETSIRRDLITPWKATYWKTLPKAHRVRYKMMYHDVYQENRGWPLLSSQVFDLQRNWYRWRS